MNYLNEQDVIHRDLRALNCYVDTSCSDSRDQECIKVGNFKYAVRVRNNNSTSVCGRVHISTDRMAWVAPESLASHEYSFKSDSWSFGVVAWEVYSFGATPYQSETSAHIAECLFREQNLAKPAKCPQDVYDIMKQCWTLDPASRPYFEVIEFKLEAMLFKA